MLKYVLLSLAFLPFYSCYSDDSIPDDNFNLNVYLNARIDRTINKCYYSKTDEFKYYYWGEYNAFKEIKHVIENHNYEIND